MVPSHQAQLASVAAVKEELARTILLDICTQDTISLTRAYEALILRESQGIKPETPMEWKVCTNCSKIFHDDYNTDTACHYHMGEMEPDDDFDVWADTDERIHGPIASEENKEEFPEGFIWDCCDKLGTDPGCQTSRHESPEETLAKEAEESRPTSASRTGTGAAEVASLEVGSDAQPVKRQRTE
ncbi:hypothetical protein SODALDRAFT_46806 [Sodiomyces alkalinus F11]|uniref:C2H2-type domain-containing protein n=1 Tax=Sodiomyces alkalinus (strain CBS 110278 / VKM F-3762 / F11) TaxID=1314773 RepID=A0A3N2QAG9_SODAK|nr:hypothetical protein SODALDRAFT_46806 [Sodiomyces alkalinus F11]ROT43749.1 hypothetical protein SODALDRAFT_46806 [Sodiomyces alkalinus F11]